MVKRKKTNKLVNSNCKKATYKRKYKSKRVGQLKLRNGKPYCIKSNRSSKYINKLRRGTNKKSKKNSRINEVLAGEGESNGDTQTITIKQMDGTSHTIPAPSKRLKITEIRRLLEEKGKISPPYQLFIGGQEEKLKGEDEINRDEDIFVIPAPFPIEDAEIKSLVKKMVRR